MYLLLTHLSIVKGVIIKPTEIEALNVTPESSFELTEFIVFIDSISIPNSFKTTSAYCIYNIIYT